MADVDTHIFRVSLGPKLYRDIEIPSTAMLYRLAETIVRAFDFDFDHAFGFFSKLKGNIYQSPTKYELFADAGGLSVKRTRVIEAFAATGAKMSFLFDYGDEWLFQVEVIGRSHREPGIKYPRVLTVVGEAPEQYPDPDEE
jgi:pRiA4b ORF-3-like protein